MGVGRKALSQRRDARENRDRIIAAARAVFADHGFDVALDAIARRAGVGRGTLYRNFPDRYALGAAIFEGNLQTLEALAAEHRGSADAFTTLLHAIVEQQVECHALVPAILSGPDAPDLHALSRRMTRLLGDPVRRAQKAGLLRTDLSVADVFVVLTMIAGVITAESTMRKRRAQAARALDLLSTGMTPTARQRRR